MFIVFVISRFCRKDAVISPARNAQRRHIPAVMDSES